MNIYTEIIEIKKALGYNNTELGQLINKSGDTFRKAMNRENLSDYEIKILLKSLSKLNSDKNPNVLLKINQALNYIRKKINVNKQLLKDKILNLDNENELFSKIKNDPAYQDLFIDSNNEEYIQSEIVNELNEDRLNYNELKIHYNKLLKKVNKTIEDLEKDVDGLDGYKELAELINLKEEIQLKLNSLK